MYLKKLISNHLLEHNLLSLSKADTFVLKCSFHIYKIYDIMGQVYLYLL